MKGVGEKEKERGRKGEEKNVGEIDQLVSICIHLYQGRGSNLQPKYVPLKVD